MQPKREFPPNASLVFEGKLVDVYQWPQTMFDGTIQTFEAVSRCDSAGVILVDDMGRIGINRQEQPHRPPFLSLYGGRIESNEEPLLWAKREVLEESGYEADEWDLLMTVGGTSVMRLDEYIYVARSIRKVTEQSLDAGERIEEVWVSFDEFVDMLIYEKIRISPKLSLLFARAKIDGTIGELRERILGK